jgi:hypothetical protein
MYVQYGFLYLILTLPKLTVRVELMIGIKRINMYVSKKPLLEMYLDTGKPVLDC